MKRMKDIGLACKAAEAFVDAQRTIKEAKAALTEALGVSKDAAVRVEQNRYGDFTVTVTERFRFGTV